jgi:hypothetical protein
VIIQQKVVFVKVSDYAYMHLAANDIRLVVSDDTWFLIHDSWDHASSREQEDLRTPVMVNMLGKWTTVYGALPFDKRNVRLTDDSTGGFWYWPWSMIAAADTPGIAYIEDGPCSENERMLESFGRIQMYYPDELESPGDLKALFK